MDGRNPPDSFRGPAMTNERTARITGARRVLPVGSVGLSDRETVFRTLAGTVGELAPCLPDGECGERTSWIGGVAGA